MTQEQIEALTHEDYTMFLAFGDPIVPVVDEKQNVFTLALDLSKFTY